MVDPNGRPSSKGIPEKLRKLNALKMNYLHCPTLELAVQPNKEYNLISESLVLTYINKFESNVYLILQV